MELNESQKLRAKIAIFVVTAVINTGSILTILLAEIAKAFPAASLTEVQNVYSLTALSTTVSCIAMGFLARRFHLKHLVIMGLASETIGGLIPVIVHGSLAPLYVSALLIGIGWGGCSVLAVSLIMAFFRDREQGAVMGIYAAIATLSGAVYTMLGGFVADSFGWVASYGLFATVALGTLVAVALLPLDQLMGQGDAAQEKGSVALLTKRGMVLIGTRYLLFMGYAVFAVFVALFVSGTGIGSTTDASLATTVQMLAAAATSMVFVRISDRLGFHALTAAGAVAILGLLAMAFAQGMLLVFVSSALIGVAVGIINASQGTYVAAVCDDPRQNPLTISMLTSFGTIAIMTCPALVNSITAMWTSDAMHGAFFTGAGIAVVAFVATFAICASLAKGAQGETASTEAVTQVS